MGFNKYKNNPRKVLACLYNCYGTLCDWENEEHQNSYSWVIDGLNKKQALELLEQLDWVINGYQFIDWERFRKNYIFSDRPLSEFNTLAVAESLFEALKSCEILL